MAKIKLGAAPKTFKKLITLPMLDGQKGTVEMQYIYRTRAEFSEFMDTSVAQIKAQDAEDQKRIERAFLEGDTDAANMTDMVKKSLVRNTEHILHIAQGWDLDVEFNRDNIHQLCDEYPGAALAITETYLMAVMNGRLGN